MVCGMADDDGPPMLGENPLSGGEGTLISGNVEDEAVDTPESSDSGNSGGTATTGGTTSAAATQGGAQQNDAQGADVENAAPDEAENETVNEPAAEIEAEAESAAEQGAENPAPEFEASVTVPEAQASRPIMPIIIAAAAVVVIAAVLVLVLTKGRRGRHT